MLVQEVKDHLVNKIIPFWNNLRDDEYGGYYGYLSYDLHLDKKAVKGCILNSRILWFYSNAYKELQDETLLMNARHAYQYLRESCIDKEHGGVYWSLQYDGVPDDTTKHTYNQAFAVYALSSYYDVSRDEDALKLAWDLYDVIEGRCMDLGLCTFGYMESFDRQFVPEVNDKLSENGVIADKTMNTLLHVMEAYTELYRVTKDEKVAGRLRWMMDVIESKIYNPEKRRQEVFFDQAYHTLIDLHSYGHDIETAWLVDLACEVLGDLDLSERMEKITSVLAETIYERAYRDHSLLNECECGTDDETRVWWVQAEAIVGFVNAYQKCPEKKAYIEAAVDIWGYVKDYMIDKREGSEWYSEVDSQKVPVAKPIVEPWKCPYHNGRMCLEVMRRGVDVS